MGKAKPTLALVQAHEIAGKLVKRTLHEATFYPPHPPRKQTPEYRKVRERLIVKEDRPCLVCGVTNSVLDDEVARKDREKNPFGAKQMELHHHIIEWALMKAVDLERFNERIVTALHAQRPLDLEYCDPLDHERARTLSQAEMEAWIDHSPANLWVLCDLHHRHSWVGIHAITGPVWGSLDLVRTPATRASVIS